MTQVEARLSYMTLKALPRELPTSLSARLRTLRGEYNQGKVEEHLFVI